MFTPGAVEPVPPMVGTWTPGWGKIMTSLLTSGPSSGTWPAANTGYWHPVSIPTTCVAKRMWWVNGATVSATYNLEAGIYLDGGFKPGAKLITTGSVAQGTLNVVQFADITDTVLPPGLYWLWLSCSSTNATVMRLASGDTGLTPIVVFQQASVGPGSAPTTATPAEATTTLLHAFGFSTTTIT